MGDDLDNCRSGRARYGNSALNQHYCLEANARFGVPDLSSRVICTLVLENKSSAKDLLP
jgi:hypothetical protein